MKVTVIIGSPRGKGNSYNLTKQFEEKVKKLGDYKFEYIFLNKVKLLMCKGCHNCIFKGEKYCPLKDDRDKIENKMLKSVAVIIVSPVYVLTVPGILKNFIDRIAYNFHRPKYFNQKMFFITAGIEYGAKRLFKFLNELNGTGFQVIGNLSVLQELLPFSENMINNNNKIVEKAALNFDKKMKENKKLKATFGDLVQLRAMRTVAGFSPENFSADYKYYKEKGWLDKKTKHFTDRKVNFIKLVFANFVEKIIKNELQKNINFQKIGNGKIK